MREKIYRIAAVLFYLLLISYLTGSPHLILDVRGMLAVLLGLALFSLPQLGGYLKRIKGEAGSFWNKLAYNGMMSGYLTTVLFLVSGDASDEYGGRGEHTKASGGGFAPGTLWTLYLHGVPREGDARSRHLRTAGGEKRA